MTSWRLSPSDFAFLWEECEQCYYLKVHGQPRPSLPMPKIFTAIDLAMKRRLMHARTETIAPGMPAGTIAYAGNFVTSAPIAFPGRNSTVYLRGPFDSVVRFDDATYGVIDFKTSAVRGGNLDKYARQLAAYAHALENPAPGAFALSPVTKLGLVVFEPLAFDADPGGRASLAGELAWIELPHDPPAFLSFLAGVAEIVDGPGPPEPGPECAWCAYRDGGRDATR